MKLEGESFCPVELSFKYEAVIKKKNSQVNSPKSSGTQKPTKKTVLDINFKSGREKSRRCYSTLHEVKDCVCGSNY